MQYYKTYKKNIKIIILFVNEEEVERGRERERVNYKKNKRKDNKKIIIKRIFYLNDAESLQLLRI